MGASEPGCVVGRPGILGKRPPGRQRGRPLDFPGTRPSFPPVISFRTLAGGWAIPLLLLAAGSGAAGAVGGLLLPDRGDAALYRPALAPPAGEEPGLPLPWSSRALSPAQLQALGMEQAVDVLALLALGLLGVGAGSAAFLAATEVSSRRRERAVRGLVGAPPRRLLARGVLAAAVLALAGGGAGFGLARAGSAALVGRWPGELAAGAPDLRIPLLLALAGGALVLAAASLPLLRVLRAGWLGDALAPHARTNPGLDEELLRTGLVTGQVLLAVTLLYGAGLLASGSGLLASGSGPSETGRVSAASGSAPRTSEAGSPRQALPMAGLLVVDVEASDLPEVERWPRYRELLQEARGMPGVAAAGLASRGALGGRGMLDWVIVPVGGEHIALGFHAEHHAVTPEWFDTLEVAAAEDVPQNGVVGNATLGRFAAWAGPEGEGDRARTIRLAGDRGINAELAALLDRAWRARVGSVEEGGITWADAGGLVRDGCRRGSRGVDVTEGDGAPALCQVAAEDHGAAALSDAQDPFRPDRHDSTTPLRTCAGPFRLCRARWRPSSICRGLDHHPQEEDRTAQALPDREEERAIGPDFRRAAVRYIHSSDRRRLRPVLVHPDVGPL